MKNPVGSWGVLHALIIRDLMARYGRLNLGFVWTVLEPMILTCGVMMVWSVIKEPIIHGIPVITFVLTGYMPLTLWRHLTGPMTRILRNNSNLLYHDAVSPFGVVISRAILEFFSTSAALIIICFVATSLGIVEPIADYGTALEAWLFTAWYFGGMGLLIGAWTELWEPAEKFIPPLQYLALPISGVFFMVDWVPEYAQRLLLINPSVHCFEMFRAGFFGPAVITHYDTWYLAVWCAGMSVAGAAAIYNVRHRIQFA
jgi:capsular polysaccharide transport system permease protein